jgi:hypothetical protein
MFLMQTGGPAVIYAMILKLCEAGYAGQDFVAHDGRIPCLYGVISRLSVPLSYGGDPKPQKGTACPA